VSAWKTGEDDVFGQTARRQQPQRGKWFLSINCAVWGCENGFRVWWNGGAASLSTVSFYQTMYIWCEGWKIPIVGKSVNSGFLCPLISSYQRRDMTETNKPSTIDICNTTHCISADTRYLSKLINKTLPTTKSFNDTTWSIFNRITISFRLHF
jgi:hypothetical protein